MSAEFDDPRCLFGAAATQRPWPAVLARPEMIATVFGLTVAVPGRAGHHRSRSHLSSVAQFFSSWNGGETYGRRGPAGLDCQQFGTPSG
jgi:hypothetical protein